MNASHVLKMLAAVVGMALSLAVVVVPAVAMAGALAFELAGALVFALGTMLAWVCLALVVLGVALVLAWRIKRGSQDRKSAQTLVRASRVFALVERLVPQHVADEEIGDAMEVIGQMVEQECSPQRIQAYVAATVAWLLINGLRDRWSRRAGAPSARR